MNLNFERFLKAYPEIHAMLEHIQRNHDSMKYLVDNAKLLMYIQDVYSRWLQNSYPVITVSREEYDKFCTKLTKKGK